MNLHDTRIIDRHGSFAVLAQRHEVMWPDGTALALHPVQQNGHDSLFHRAVVTPGGLTIVFDLREVCPPLASELPATPPRDVIGTVYYRLRQTLPTAGELWRLASAKFDACWLPGVDAVAAA